MSFSAISKRRGVVKRVWWVLLALSMSLSAAPVSCLTVSRKDFAKGGRIAVVSTVQDDDAPAPGVICSMLEQDFRNAGFRVVADPEDADLVVVATAGRIGSFRRPESTASLAGLSDFRGGGAVTPAMHVEVGNLVSDAGVERAGLLLTAFRAVDWVSLSEKGVVPSAVWRVFASGYYMKGELGAGARELSQCAVSTVRASAYPEQKK